MYTVYIELDIDCRISLYIHNWTQVTEEIISSITHTGEAHDINSRLESLMHSCIRIVYLEAFKR